MLFPDEFIILYWCVSSVFYVSLTHTIYHSWFWLVSHDSLLIRSAFWETKSAKSKFLTTTDPTMTTFLPQPWGWLLPCSWPCFYIPITTFYSVILQKSQEVPGADLLNWQLVTNPFWPHGYFLSRIIGPFIIYIYGLAQKKGLFMQKF